MKAKALLPLFLLSISSICKAQVSQSDSLALVDFYNKTQPKNGSWSRHNNWLTAAPLNDWTGVTVAGKRVTQLTLTYNNITGKLPPSFLNLTALKVMNFKGNTALSIALNANISKLKSLKTLNLQSTNTTGTIPAEIAQLTSLEYLDMSHCFLTGTIPGSIDKMTKLGTLILSYSGMSGALPESIGNAPALSSIYLDGNQFSGALPQSMGNLTSLSSLVLNHNNFSGSLPLTGYWPNLSYIDLDANHFSGSLPVWLGRSHSLYHFEITRNEFTGSVPEEWGDSLTRIYTVYASYNQLSGPIPGWLLSKPTLDEVLLDNNEFSRQDNPCITLSSSIDNYNLSDNRYNFNGLECLAANGSYLRVNPQAPLTIGTKGNKLTLSAGGTLSNNTYTWYQVGTTQAKVITGDSTYTPLQSGQYYATITSKSVTTLTLYTDTVTYAKTAKQSDVTITLSPNPARSQLTVYGLNDKADVLVRVTDQSGHTWMQATSRRQAMLRLNVAELRTGHYFLVVSDGMSVKTLPFIKE